MAYSRPRPLARGHDRKSFSCGSRWYRRFGFEESPSDPLHLMLLMKDLRAFLSPAR